MTALRGTSNPPQGKVTGSRENRREIVTASVKRNGHAIDFDPSVSKEKINHCNQPTYFVTMSSKKPLIKQFVCCQSLPNFMFTFASCNLLNVGGWALHSTHFRAGIDLDSGHRDLTHFLVS